MPATPTKMGRSGSGFSTRKTQAWGSRPSLQCVGVQKVTRPPHPPCLRRMGDGPMDYMIREEVVLSVKNPSLKSVWLLRPDNYHKMIVACFGLLVGGKSRASCLFINARARARTQVRQAGRLAGQTGRQTRQACTRLRFFPLPLSIAFASSEPDAGVMHCSHQLHCVEVHRPAAQPPTGQGQGRRRGEWQWVRPQRQNTNTANCSPGSLLACGPSSEPKWLAERNLVSGSTGVPARDWLTSFGKSFCSSPASASVQRCGVRIATQRLKRCSGSHSRQPARRARRVCRLHRRRRVSGPQPGGWQPSVSGQSKTGWQWPRRECRSRCRRLRCSSADKRPRFGPILTRCPANTTAAAAFLCPLPLCLFILLPFALLCQLCVVRPRTGLCK